MLTSTLLFLALFSGLSQQLGTVGHGTLLKQRHALIQARQSGGDLSFCYSEASICSEGNDLFEKCSAFEGQADDTQWYQCLCGNGYVEASQECHWCDEVYGIPDVDLSDLNTSQCNRYNGGTIAPLPASVLAALSAFNATYTGVISGAAGGGSEASTTSASGGEGSIAGTASATPITVSSTPRSTSASSKAASSSTPTATVVETLNGGSPGSLTAAPTTNQGGVETSSPSTTIKSGSGSGGAQGRNTGLAVVFSTVAFAFSVLCLL